MNKTYALEGAYLVATSSVSHEKLRGALVYIYQVDGEVVSGVVINKPSSKRLGDLLEYPAELKNMQVWHGGPVGTERLIAFSHRGKDVYITDRLANLTKAQVRTSMFLSGQCVWELSALLQQVKEGDWVLVGSNYLIPQQIPAELRADYILRASGISSERYVASAEAELA
ncbi:MAG: YqgE/AlgH family protein [Pseudomonadota bacterium]|nr:YqgE/AlgH family protein [Pseudomonadota bacterium]